MERSRGTKTGLKLMAAGLALVAAMATTGCGQNALLNPTADQIAASQTADANQAKSDDPRRWISAGRRHIRVASCRGRKDPYIWRDIASIAALTRRDFI